MNWMIVALFALTISARPFPPVHPNRPPERPTRPPARPPAPNPPHTPPRHLPPPVRPHNPPQPPRGLPSEISEQEYQTNYGINHPFFLHVFGNGVYDGGRYFYFMEPCDWPEGTLVFIWRAYPQGDLYLVDDVSHERILISL